MCIHVCRMVYYELEELYVQYAFLFHSHIELLYLHKHADIYLGAFEKYHWPVTPNVSIVSNTNAQITHTQILN